MNCFKLLPTCQGKEWAKSLINVTYYDMFWKKELGMFSPIQIEQMESYRGELKIHSAQDDALLKKRIARDELMLDSPLDSHHEVKDPRGWTCAGDG